MDNSNNDQYNSQGNVSSEEWERMTRSLRKPYKELEQISKEKERVSIESFEPELVQAKSPAVAWQKRWKTPTDFLCCPSEVSNNTITEYFNNLIIGCNYNSTLYYGNDKPDFQKIVDKAYIDDNNSILVFSVNEGGIKPYALSKIYISDDKIIHESIGTFFAEDGARKAELRENFDVATSRAVANMAVLSEYCLPYVKLNGHFVALKGPAIEDEIRDGKKAIMTLGGELESIIEVTIEESDLKHNIVEIKKIILHKEILKSIRR